VTITEEKLAELRGAHRRIKLITIGDVSFVIRAPKRHEYKQFRSKSFGDGKAEAMEDLLRLLVVEPTRVAFDEVLEEYPGLAESKDVQNAVSAFVGMVADTEGKASVSTSNTSKGAPDPSPTG
jgi:hypothetical protein